MGTDGLNSFQRDILQQPHSLRRLAEYYSHGQGRQLLDQISPPSRPILTGMGASFHAAWVASLHLQSRGIHALAIEAADLLHYSSALLETSDHLVFVSQSGASAEIAPILDRLPSKLELTAVTNDQGSALGSRATNLVPLLVDSEALVASKTYINSLAMLWLLTSSWCDDPDGKHELVLGRIAGEIELLLKKSKISAQQWMDVIYPAETIYFVGHGPHAATARQASMMLSERAKRPALHASVGAFRHGIIEVAGPEIAVVIFSPPGDTYPSAHSLAEELNGYDARVLLVENGHLAPPTGERDVQEREIVDEFLSPILDIIPVQIFVEELRERLGVEPGFRYIEKIVKRL